MSSRIVVSAVLLSLFGISFSPAAFAEGEVQAETNIHVNQKYVGEKKAKKPSKRVHNPHRPHRPDYGRGTGRVENRNTNVNTPISGSSAAAGSDSESNSNSTSHGGTGHGGAGGHGGQGGHGGEGGNANSSSTSQGGQGGHGGSSTSSSNSEGGEGGNANSSSQGGRGGNSNATGGEGGNSSARTGNSNARNGNVSLEEGSTLVLPDGLDSSEPVQPGSNFTSFGASRGTCAVNSNYAATKTNSTDLRVYVVGFGVSQSGPGTGLDTQARDNADIARKIATGQLPLLPQCEPQPQPVTSEVKLPPVPVPNVPVPSKQVN